MEMNESPSKSILQLTITSPQKSFLLSTVRKGVEIKYDHSDNYPAHDSAGGEHHRQITILDWVKKHNLKQQHNPLLREEMVKLGYEVNKIKRTDFPIYLNPETASFLDVAIHAKIRQYLADSTIEKNLRYARFMETHPAPINFRNLTPEQFIRHMAYRIEYENATPFALAHERKAIIMFLRAFGINEDNWKILCKNPSSYHQRRC